MQYKNIGDFLTPGTPTQGGNVIQMLFSPTAYDAVRKNIKERISLKYPFPRDFILNRSVTEFLAEYVRAAGKIRSVLSSSTMTEYSREIAVFFKSDDLQIYLDELIEEMKAGRVPAAMVKPWTVSPEQVTLIESVYRGAGLNTIVFPVIAILGLVALIQIAPAVSALVPRRIR